MQDYEQNDTLVDRLDSVQQDNQLRNDADVQKLKSQLAGAGRYLDNSLISNLKPLEKQNDSIGKDVDKGLNDVISNNKNKSSVPMNNNINNRISNNNSRGFSTNTLNSNNNGNKLISDNDYDKINKKNQLKRKAQVEAMSRALSKVNPAVAAASKSKTGQAILNAVAKKHNMAKGGLAKKFLPTGDEKTDSNGKTESETSKENSIEKVTMIIMSPKAMLIIPICIACFIILIGVCIVMTVGQVQSTIFGLDASDSVSSDSKDVQDKLTKEEDKLSDDHVDNEITE